jgi:hypothetical protein
MGLQQWEVDKIQGWYILERHWIEARRKREKNC